MHVTVNFLGGCIRDLGFYPVFITLKDYGYAWELSLVASLMLLFDLILLLFQRHSEQMLRYF